MAASFPPRYMDRRPVQELGSIHIADLKAWIELIPEPDWPEYRPHYPAMVRDPSWHDFGRKTKETIQYFERRFGCRAVKPCLSLLAPGQKVRAHEDKQGPFWRTRIHVPILTNPLAALIYGQDSFHLAAGSAYAMETRLPHAIQNLGPSNRVHLFFDLMTR